MSHLASTMGSERRVPGSDRKGPDSAAPPLLPLPSGDDDGPAPGDDMTAVVGEFGAWQIVLLTAVSLSVCAHAMQMMAGKWLTYG